SPIAAIMPSRRARSIKALAYLRAAAPPFTALLLCHCVGRGRQLNGAPFPATVSAEGGQFNGPPSPAIGQHVNSRQPPRIPPHQHTAWYLARDEALGKAGNVPEFHTLGR